MVAMRPGRVRGRWWERGGVVDMVWSGRGGWGVGRLGGWGWGDNGGWEFPRVGVPKWEFPRPPRRPGRWLLVRSGGGKPRVPRTHRARSPAQSGLPVGFRTGQTRCHDRMLPFAPNTALRESRGVARIPGGIVRAFRDWPRPGRQRTLQQWRPGGSAADGNQGQLLGEVPVTIKAGRSMPADAIFFYLRSGPDLVVRSKCDGTEVARVAVAEVERPVTVVGG